jgi:hypothetical protein
MEDEFMKFAMAFIRWCVTNDGETLFDNPIMLAWGWKLLAEYERVRTRNAP